MRQRTKLDQPELPEAEWIQRLVEEIPEGDRDDSLPIVGLIFAALGGALVGFLAASAMTAGGFWEWIGAIR